MDFNKLDEIVSDLHKIAEALIIENKKLLLSLSKQKEEFDEKNDIRTLSYDEASKESNISVNHLKKMVSTGILKSFSGAGRSQRIKFTDLRLYINKNTN